jgi:Skp family chaperone for outer membrane proteins
MTIKLSFIILLFCGMTHAAESQQPMKFRIEAGDTIYCDSLPEAMVRGRFNNRKYRRFRKTVYNLKKVYPYAQVAKRKLAEMDAHYASLKSDKDRKKYAKQIEKELISEFDAPLRKLTISQGRMLILLIDRETGRTSYKLVKEFRGGFGALFWQGIARLFGNNLKSEYDPDGEDKILEELVRKCEEGTFDSLYLSMFGV